MVGLDVKGRNLHGMRDERWTTFAKVDQYKQLISLQKRDKEVAKYMLASARRQENHVLGELRKIAKQKQDELRNALLGNQNKMWSTFGEHRRIQLALGRNSPEFVIESLYQMIDYKRKMKDKQRYMRRLLMRQYKMLVLKRSEQEDRIIMQKFGIKTVLERRMYTSCQYKQNAVMKTLAATSVMTAYTHILKILNKDAIYYNSVLDCLEGDCKMQSQMILSVTHMGQIVTEYVDDISTECENLEQGIRVNMLEREKSLMTLRETLKHMGVTFKKLVRTDSPLLFPKIKESFIDEELALKDELTKMEKILEDVKTVALVSGYEHVYPILVVQNRQSIRLHKLKEQLFMLKNSLVKGTNQLEIILNLISHTYNEKKIKYLENKRNLLRSIRKEHKIINELQTSLSRRSEMTYSIRKAFQHMWNMLKNVRLEGQDLNTSGYVLSDHGEYVMLFDTRPRALLAEPTRKPLSMIPEGEDAISLMETAKKKLQILFDAFKPDSALMRQAHLFYSRALTETQDIDEGECEIDLLEGLVIENSRLPTHASVKKDSAQFVVDNTVDELALVAAQVAARRRPGTQFRKMFKEEEIRRKNNKCCGIY